MTESQLHEAIADYLRLRHPKAIFHSDFGSGLKMSIGQAVRQKRLNGGRRAWADIFIAEPKGEYHGMFLELKKSGTAIRKKDGSLVANPHIREQHSLLSELRARGYYADFAVGLDDAMEKIDSYLNSH